MTSDSEPPREAFVWIWLPRRTAPVVAGRIRAHDGYFDFAYGRSYLNREDAISIYDPELPLRPEVFLPNPPLKIANSLRDASPDSWGRRVIHYQLFQHEEQGRIPRELDELTLLLESGSDRIGALDFQRSPQHYVPREGGSETLEDLMAAAERVDQGRPLAPALAEALLHSSSVGGARPKVMIRDGDARYIAKFSRSEDPYDVIKAEFVAMRLACLAGLNTAPVRLIRVMDRDVLLVERFDRVRTDAGWTRRAIVSAHTLLGLDPYRIDEASYETLADRVRAQFTAPGETLKELFARMTFNVLVSNTDDHARNHAAFWDGSRLALTPAYDVCPQLRGRGSTFQAMRIHRRERRSHLSLCLAAAHKFLLSEEQALALMRQQIATITDCFGEVCREAGVDGDGRVKLWRNHFLNPLTFDGLEQQLGEPSIAEIEEANGGTSISPGERELPSPG